MPVTHLQTQREEDLRRLWSGEPSPHAYAYTRWLMLNPASTMVDLAAMALEWQTFLDDQDPDHAGTEVCIGGEVRLLRPKKP